MLVSNIEFIFTPRCAAQSLLPDGVR